jgi:hypothetical protein
MQVLYDVSYFVGGAFLTNAVPHFVSGVCGRAFQSPFAKPPGQGVSSSASNVVWGFLNGIVAYVLICRVGAFSLRATGDAVALGLGIFLAGFFLARYFGRFHGGTMPEGS